MAVRVIRLSAIALLVIAIVGPSCSSPDTITEGRVLDTIPPNLDCSRAVPNPSLRITNPQDGAVIPNNLRYPIIEWAKPDREMDAFLIRVKSSTEQLDVALTGRRWRPKGAEFEPFLKEREAVVTLFGLRGDTTYVGPSLKIIVSDSPLTEKIAYRMVHPLFKPDLPNAIKILSPEKREPETLMALDGTCIGCHAYSLRDALFNIKKGSARRLLTVSERSGTPEPRQQDLKSLQFMTMTRSGKQALLVVNAEGATKKTKSVLEPFELPYRSGDIHCLDLETNLITPLKGACDPDVVEDMPCFSHDGQYVIFSRYRFDAGNKERPIASMTLYKLPFNDGRGGESVPIEVASPDLKYQYFARCSPDGKWISFCSGDAARGVFALKSSDIYRMPAGGGAPVKLNLNLDGSMDSWHDWSSDSKWLLFASKREPTGMTALYLVHIDETGRDHPPVKLAGYDNMKVNTPRFLSACFDPKEVKGLKAFIDGAFTSK